MRVTFTTLLAATVLVACIGFQLLEATGLWDRTLQDAGDEAAIVVAVLCVGSALAAARVVRRVTSLARVPSRIAPAHSALRTLVRVAACPGASASPPVSLRI